MIVVALGSEPMVENQNRERSRLRWGVEASTSPGRESGQHERNVNSEITQCACAYHGLATFLAVPTCR